MSIAHEDLLVLGNIVGKLSNLTLSEDDTSRVLVIEVKHRHDLNMNTLLRKKLFGVRGLSLYSRDY